ncbi:hypothetical protein [Mucilaginibacter lappiensis]|uniref:hypothetical protein n=1 Tax=Mucilaginibacter lappiensis TaxID=354630 RepID=UPI003D1AB38A
MVRPWIIWWCVFNELLARAGPGTVNKKNMAIAMFFLTAKSMMLSIKTHGKPGPDG